MSLTSSIYDWAAARVDERDLVEIMRKHGYSIRRTDGKPVAARPVPDDVKRQFDEEVDRLVREASRTLVRLDCAEAGPGDDSAADIVYQGKEDRRRPCVGLVRQHLPDRRPEAVRPRAVARGVHAVPGPWRR